MLSVKLRQLLPGPAAPWSWCQSRGAPGQEVVALTFDSRCLSFSLEGRVVLILRLFLSGLAPEGGFFPVGRVKSGR